MFELILSNMQKSLQAVHQEKLLALNRESEEYGLALTKEDTRGIIESRAHALKQYDRIDMGVSVAEKIIRKFCKSQYINQDDYGDTISEIQDIFYCLKNETEDAVPDDKLVDILWRFYEKVCRGSIEGVRTKADVFGQRFRIIATMREMRKNRDGHSESQ